MLEMLLFKNNTEHYEPTQASLVRQLIDMFPVPVFFKNKHSQYTAFNSLFAKEIFGMPEDEILGRNVFDLPHANQKNAHTYNQHDSDLFRTGGVQVYIANVSCANGKEEPFLFVKKAVHFKSPAATGLIGLMYKLDVDTLQRFANKKSENTTVNAMAAGTARQMSGPIGQVLNTLENLKRHHIHMAALHNKTLQTLEDLKDKQSGKQEKQKIETLLAELKESEHVVDDMLEFIDVSLQATRPLRDLVETLSTFEFGHSVKNTDVEIPARAVAMAVQLVKNRAQCNINVCEGLDELPEIPGHFGLLVQVFVNLLTNAIKAAGTGGQVEIRSYQQHKHSYILITDNGKGLPEVDSAVLFHPFYTAWDDGEGSGLGLTAVQSILQKYGGSITLENREDGGCLATVCLPKTS